MYEFIQEFCLSKRGASEDYKKEWDAIRYMIGNKMFALIGNDAQGRAIISVKHTAERGAELRELYSDITPGYYLNKKLWSSVLLHGNTPENVLKDMIVESYNLVLHSLPKKQIEQIIQSK